MKKLILTTLLSISCFIGQSQQAPPEKPDGYFSNFTLKIAYALGRLDLVETEFPLPENITEYKDIVYNTIESTDLKLDIYHKANTDKPMPLLIFIHGGAWKKGDKHDYWPYLIPFAEKGYITATIQYRFSGIAKYPAQLNDVSSAVKWLQDNAEQFHIDPNKIVLIGGSAGGHLAMMAGYTNLSLKIKGVVNLYGPADLTIDYARETPSVIKLIGKSYEEAPELYKQASPISFINKHIPPTLIFQGMLDEIVPYDQSDNLDKKIKEAGAISYYHKLKGWPHTMDASVEVNKYCTYYMYEFFEKYIPKN
ncbi:MAG: alpha/beta hydrolase [Flavobacteriaceae bacterium]|nr:alpha/beta hydrolase [Flavobacteriaceae bacterium]